MALGVLEDTVSSVLTTIRSTFNTIFQSIKNIVSDVFAEIVTSVKAAFTSIINYVIGAVNTLINIINAAIGAYNSIPIAPDISKIPNIPALAKGGIVTDATIALIGEAGPEAVVPLSGPYMPDFLQSNDGGGGGTIINISVEAGLVSSPDQVGQQIIEAIRRAERRSGQVFAAA
jgi:SLT domain-containing protein